MLKQKRFIRSAALMLALSTMLTACAGAAGQAPAAPTARPTVAPTAAPTQVPTLAPSATPVPEVAADVFVAGVDVGGMAPEEARAALQNTLAPLLRPIEVRFGERTLTLKAEDIGLQLGLDQMVELALESKSGARLPLDVNYDETKLRGALAELAPAAADEAAVSVVKATDPISRSFALDAAAAGPDIDTAIKQVDDRLRSVNGSRRITLAPGAPSADTRPTPEALQKQLDEMAKLWKGVAGVYVYDIASGAELASVNKGTVFAAASTIKVAIMLNAYVNVETFSARQERALQKMIVESDNIEANLLLAASVGGGGTEDAIKGAERMSEMLADLGLEHTYQWVPYEAGEYIRQNKLKVRSGPKDPVGPEPHTESGRWLRATPAEMAQIYIWIEQCSRGEGLLLDTFDTLTPDRCEEMIGRLEQNGDKKRMVAGLPKGAVAAHKSGWIEDMQADVGIVRSPGGEYVVAIYLYRPLGGDGVPIPDRVMMSSIAAFSRLVYTYYNPIQQ